MGQVVSPNTQPLQSISTSQNTLKHDTETRLSSKIPILFPAAEKMAIQNEPAKLRWGELEEDDGEDLDFLLPPRQVIGPDENGIKRVIEYQFDDDGNKVKITTITRIRKLANARLSKRAVERRSWPKFGDAVHEDVGARLTMVSTEEIVLERPKPLGSSLTLAFDFF